MRSALWDVSNEKKGERPRTGGFALVRLRTDFAAQIRNALFSIQFHGDYFFVVAIQTGKGRFCGEARVSGPAHLYMFYAMRHT